MKVGSFSKLLEVLLVGLWRKRDLEGESFKFLEFFFSKASSSKGHNRGINFIGIYQKKIGWKCQIDP